MPPPPPPSFAFSDDADDDDDRPARRRRGPSGSPLWDFLTFRLMITPIIIQIVFWIGVLVCVAVDLRSVVGSFESQPEAPRASWEVRESDRLAPESDRTKTKTASTRSFSTFQFASGLTLILVGPLFVRLYCELLILLFKIHDELKTANDRPRRRS